MGSNAGASLTQCTLYLQGDEFNSTVIRYVGNVPNNSTSSGRKLLQSQGITVYYNLEQVLFYHCLAENFVLFAVVLSVGRSITTWNRCTSCTAITWDIHSWSMCMRELHLRVSVAAVSVLPLKFLLLPRVMQLHVAWC